MEIRQYQIFLVNLDPTIGSEIKKTRPCLVVSPDEMNKYLRTVVVAPLTTSIKSYPTRFAVNLNKKQGQVALDQIRTIDKKRIIKKMGVLSKSEVNKCKTILRETYVD